MGYQLYICIPYDSCSYAETYIYLIVYVVLSDYVCLHRCAPLYKNNGMVRYSLLCVGLNKVVGIYYGSMILEPASTRLHCYPCSGT